VNSPLLETLAGLVVMAVPGIFAWWSGRSLVRDTDDSALPERLAAHRGRVAGVSIGAVVVAAFFLSRHSLPLLYFGIYVGTLLGSFPTRKKLFGETWDFGTYFGYSLRALVAFAGPWLLLALAPSIVASRGDGAAAWITAGVLFVVLVVWQRIYSTALVRLLELRELDRPDLAPLFAAVVAKSSVPAPRLYLLESPGGRWANAVALPRISPPSAVIFTRTLLDELTAGESAAIFAHEVAHLEHFDRRKLRRAAIAQAIAAAIACTIVLLMPVVWEPWRSWIALLLAPVIFLALAFGIIRRRAHEGESDLRAVALCGDAEALAAALAKLHTLARLPRRLASESESMHTHPSLARRLQAIRRAGGVESPAGDAFAPLVVRGAGGKCLVLDRRRAEWLEGFPNPPGDAGVDELRAGAGVAKSYAYGELVELRLDVRGAKAILVARTRSEKWTLALDPADIAAVQAKLDEIDDQLGAPRTSNAAQEVASPIVAFVLFLLTMALVRSLPAASAAAVAVFRPAASTLAAAGGAGLAAALLSLVATALGPFVPLQAIAIVLSLVLFWIARRRLGDEADTQGRLVLAVVVLLVAALPSAFGFMVGVETGWIEGRSVVSQYPGMTVALAGIAAALVYVRRRALAALAALAACGPFLLAALVTGGEGLNDPLRAPPTSIALDTIATREIGSFDVPRIAVGVRSSPTGAVHAVELRDVDDEYEDDSAAAAPLAPRFEVGPLDGPRATIEGFELGFVDDRRVLVVAVAEGRAEIREVNLRDPKRVGWKASIPYLVQPHLSVDPESASFRLVGKDTRSRAFVRLRGRVGEDGVKEDRWAAPNGSPLTFYEWYATDGPRALALGMASPQSRLFLQPWMIMLIDPTHLYRHELWSVGGEAPRRILSGPVTLSCAQPGFAAPAVVCTSLEEQRTKVFSIGAATGSLGAIASVERAFIGAAAVASEGRLAAATGSEVVIVDLIDAKGRLLTIAPPGSRSWVRALDLSGSRLAVLAQGDSARVMLFEVPAG